MFSKQRWLIPAAFTVLFWIVGGTLSSPIILDLSAVGVIATLVALAIDFWPRSKYDLGVLRELQEKEELASLDPDAYASGFDSFLCPYCDTVYSTEFKVCPKCKCSR